MLFVIIGTLLGGLFGGLKGLLIGAAIGWLAGRAVQRWLIGQLNVVQSQLLDSTFSVMGALCKTDGVVTREEIKAAERIFDMLQLGADQRRDARAAFNRGKQPDFDLDAAVDAFAQLSRRQGPLIQLFLQLQVMAVAADGKVDAAEHDMLVRVARRLGVGEGAVAQLEALLRTASAGPSGTPGGPPAGKRLEDAYAALGISKDASDAEVKRAYRRLISENHPDKLAARGLPESMRAVAEERSREINAAYDLVKDSRGM